MEIRIGMIARLTVIAFLLAVIGGCVEGYTPYEIEHPLSNKVGFSLTGKLKDGERVDYKVRRKSPLSFQVVEEVRYKKDGSTVLVDYNADGNVDRVLIEQVNELLGRDFFGFRLRYNKGVLTEEEAKEILHDADRIFNRVKVELNVNEKLESYTREVKNPLR